MKTLNEILVLCSLVVSSISLGMVIGRYISKPTVYMTVEKINKSSSQIRIDRENLKNEISLRILREK